MTLSLPAYLEECREEVFVHIRRYLRAATASLPPDMRSCVVDYPYRRGKALRPALALLFCDAHGGGGAAARRVASAYQLLEDWGLGRDDILDDALLRRGKPALHRLYGLPAAVNALDMLHACVFDMLYSYCRLPPAKYRVIHRIFAEASRVTLGGQHLDIAARKVPLRLFTREAYLDIAARKTAYYTVTVPCLLGAALAGARGQEAAVKRFGRLLGTAFQIVDDVLDVENDGGGKFGKAPGNDILEGKRTLVALYAFKRLPAAAAARLERFYGESARRTGAGAAAMRALILRSGAPALCRAEAVRLAGEAAAVFDRRLRSAMRPGPAGLLRQLIGALVQRVY